MLKTESYTENIPKINHLYTEIKAWIRPYRPRGASLNEKVFASWDEACASWDEACASWDETCASSDKACASSTYAGAAGLLKTQDIQTSGYVITLWCYKT